MNSKKIFFFSKIRKYKMKIVRKKKEMKNRIKKKWELTKKKRLN